MLIPVAVLLVTGGYIGFVYARNSILVQWREAAILELQQEAHKVDMRLSRPKQWIQMFYNTSGDGHADHHIQEWVIEQIKKVEGVTRINLTWMDEQLDGRRIDNQPTDQDSHMDPGSHMMTMAKRRAGPMRFHRAGITEITPPSYNSLVKHETVSLISDFLNETGKKVGRLEVVLRFDYLFGDMEDSVLWQNHQAFLVTVAGKILYSMKPGYDGYDIRDHSWSWESSFKSKRILPT
jgi:hypothetical protein